MTVLSDMNPIAAFLWLIVTAGVAMFCFDPIILVLSLIGALAYFLLRNPDTKLRDHLPYFLLFIVSAAANPLFSHNGATVLFVVNHNPITMEACIYGLVLGCMLLCALYWFRSFQQIMTSDKLLYVFGSALPKLTLILSIALRYIPLLRQQSKKVRDAQKALGLFKDENLIDRLRGELRIFSVLVSWALENGIITADSMAGRGYGIGRRTRFALFHFRMRDGIAVALCILLGAMTTWGLSTGSAGFSFYPYIQAPGRSVLGIFSYASYAVLALFPAMLEVEERIRWKSLKSKI